MRNAKLAKDMSSCVLLNFPFQLPLLTTNNYTSKNSSFLRLTLTNPSSLQLQPPRISRQLKASTSAAMEAEQSTTSSGGSSPPINLLFVEMGVGYDQHGCVVLYFPCPFSSFSITLPVFDDHPFVKFSYWLVGLVCFLMNCNSTGKILRLRLCGHVGMPSLPTRFRPFEEVFLLGFQRF